MTIWDLGSVLARRWYLVLLGVLCIGAACLVVNSDRGVYFSRAEVVLLLPAGQGDRNTLTTTSSDAVVLAGAVAKIINGAQTEPRAASPDATIVGRGIDDGYSLQLPDLGGQWAPSFPRQVLDVQVVGPDAEVVHERMQALIARIGDELATLQIEANVAPKDRITAQSTPTEPSVTYISGSRARALSMTALVGIAITFGTVAIVDHLIDRRGGPRRTRKRQGYESPGVERTIDKWSRRPGLRAIREPHVVPARDGNQLSMPTRHRIGR